MSVKEKALKQAMQVQQDIFSGAPIFAEDINRFRRRPTGPSGHPLLVKSERLKRPNDERDTLEDLQVAPDGTPCTLWNLSDDINYGLCVQLGSRSWLLPFDEPAVCNKGRILGFNGNEPVVEMTTSPTHEPGAPTGRVFVGEIPLQKSRSDPWTFPWNMGADGKLYRLEKLETPSADLPGDIAVQTIDLETRTFSKHYPEHRLGERDVKAVGVLDEKTFALITAKTGSGKLLITFGGRGSIVASSERVAYAVKEVRLERSGGMLWKMSICEQRDPAWVAIPVVGDERADGTKPLHGTWPYAGGLTKFDDGRVAYIGALPHEQVGWIIDGRAQPGFTRVTQLFRHSDDLRYWALGDNQLFLMELPAPKKK